MPTFVMSTPCFYRYAKGIMKFDPMGNLSSTSSSAGRHQAPLEQLCTSRRLGPLIEVLLVQLTCNGNIPHPLEKVDSTDTKKCKKKLKKALKEVCFVDEEDLKDELGEVMSFYSSPVLFRFLRSFLKHLPTPLLGSYNTPPEQYWLWIEQATLCRKEMRQDHWMEHMPRHQWVRIRKPFLGMSPEKQLFFRGLLKLLKRLSVIQGSKELNVYLLHDLSAYIAPALVRRTSKSYLDKRFGAIFTEMLMYMAVHADRIAFNMPPHRPPAPDSPSGEDEQVVEEEVAVEPYSEAEAGENMEDIGAYLEEVMDGEVCSKERNPAEGEGEAPQEGNTHEVDVEWRVEEVVEYYQEDADGPTTLEKDSGRGFFASLGDCFPVFPNSN